MADPQVRWKKTGKYSGPVIYGNKDWPKVPTPMLGTAFITKALWLLAMAETMGRRGVVNMSDGTGVTAGLQYVAVYPRDLSTGGPLWKFLWYMDHFFPISYSPLGDLFQERGWQLHDGCLATVGGSMVSMRVFRNVVTPDNGVVPRKGWKWNRAREWALAFSQLMRDERTFRAQRMYGETFLREMMNTRFKVLDGQTLKSVANLDEHDPLPFAYMPDWYKAEGYELVYCLLLSFMFNSPVRALRAYKAALKGNPMNFPKLLVRRLASECKRWDDDHPGSRYQRSRSAAMRVWDRRLFVGDRAIMPKDIPGV